MKVVIDLTSLSYHLSGIERYALCISEELLKIDDENQYILFFRNEVNEIFKKYMDNKRVCAKVIFGNNKLLFNQIILPYNLYRTKSDVNLFLAFANPILFKRKGIISILHDMGAFDFSSHDSLLKKLYFRIGCYAAAFNSDVLLTVSEFSKSRICKLLHVRPEKVHVAYSAIADSIIQSENENFDNIKNKYNLPNKYIMTLSTLEPRKNIKILLNAFSEVQDVVDYDLVLVGRKGWQMDDLISNYACKDRIHFTGFVNDEHVAGIYKNALCFVFPTLYEGFGLPPIESLSMGTPVISSNAASMPEVLRNQAVFFESNNINDLKKLLVNLEKNISGMPKCLDAYQKEQFRFDVSAKKILSILNNMGK